MEKRPKILMVDDKPENLIALEVVLKDLDVDLVRAGSGNEALKATLYHDFALALLDIQMPEMDGYELASILREDEKTARMPFIFISAVYTDNLNVFKGYEQGAFSFITKPFQPEMLVNKVKFFIEKYQQEIELFELNENLEQKNVELLMSNAELESFTYSVSHDLRAPLRAVNGYAQILEEDYGSALNEDGKRIIQSIKSNAQKMGNLIDDLLAFSRLGKKALQFAPIDMQALVKEVIKEMNKSMPHKAKIAVNTLCPIHGDHVLIRQVIINLVSNAIKYSSKKADPKISIGSREEGHEIIFMIKDNGAGFDMNYTGKLFGVFQRLHNEDEFEGTGVGLAIVHKVIAKHGGRVWAEAKVDEGATFYFSIPNKN